MATKNMLKEAAHKTYKMALELNEVNDPTLAISIILSLAEAFINEHDVDVEEFIGMFLVGAKSLADMHGFFDDEEGAN